MVPDAVVINIDSQIYSIDIIFSAIDALSAEYIFLLHKIDNKFNVIIRSRFEQTITKEQMENVIFDELNNQVIRNKILSRTENLRELIVGKALFETRAFDDDHSHFDINSYKPEENYILDQNKIIEIYRQDETK